MDNGVPLSTCYVGYVRDIFDENNYAALVRTIVDGRLLVLDYESLVSRLKLSTLCDPVVGLALVSFLLYFFLRLVALTFECAWLCCSSSTVNSIYVYVQ